MPRCPECDARIDLDPDELEPGDVVDCPECGVELEVVDVNPIVLDFAPDDEEE